MNNVYDLISLPDLPGQVANKCRYKGYDFKKLHKSYIKVT